MAATYTVKRGDTLNKIAAANNMTLAQLLRLNPQISDPDLIHPGDTINLEPTTAGEESREEEILEAEGLPEEEPTPVEEGPSALGKVMTGGQTIKVETPEGTRYYEVYEYPPGSGEYMSFQYESLEQVESAHGGVPPMNTWSQARFDRNVNVEAEASEIVGEGDFYRYVEEVVREEAEKAGIDDPGVAGRIANDPEMQEIMAQAAIGDWSEEEIMAAKRNTRFWKEELYPGIERFYEMNIPNPEQAWREYAASVEGALEMLGYERDANGTYAAQVGRMLELGISDSIFVSQAVTFARAKENADFAKVLNEWAERDLGKSIDFEDWFLLVEGETLSELNALAEKATIAYAAEEMDFEISIEKIEELSEKTDLSDAQARQIFADVHSAMLALGDFGLNRGGLTRDDILSASANVSPSSGKSVEEVKRLVAKLAKENDLFDEEKLSLYMDFDPSGRPIRPGLQVLAPEGA